MGKLWTVYEWRDCIGDVVVWKYKPRKIFILVGVRLPSYVIIENAHTGGQQEVHMDEITLEEYDY